MGHGSGAAHRLTPEERGRLQALIRSGHTHGEAALVIGCSSKSVQRLLAQSGGLKSRSKPRSALRLSPVEREEISRGMQARLSCRSIAKLLGRSPSTVSRDVGKGDGGLTSAEREELTRLRRENRRLKEEREIL